MKWICFRCNKLVSDYELVIKDNGVGANFFHEKCYEEWIKSRKKDDTLFHLPDCQCNEEGERIYHEQCNGNCSCGCWWNAGEA